MIALGQDETDLLKGKRTTMSKNSTMTRKHFELIATVIRGLAAEGEQVGKVIDRFADALEATNEGFDRDRFVRACLDKRTPLDKSRARM